MELTVPLASLREVVRERSWRYTVDCSLREARFRHGRLPDDSHALFGNERSFPSSALMSTKSVGIGNL